MMRRLLKDETGMTMGLAVIMIVLIGVMGAGLLTFVRTDLNAVVEVNQGQKAFEMADAGVEAAKQQLISEPDPKRYDNNDTLILDSAWAKSKGGANLSMDSSTVNVQIQSNTPSPGLYTVISTGSSRDAKRRVEAVYKGTSSTGVSPSYFTRTNLTLRGTANLSSISLFALGNVKVEGGANIGNATDAYFKKWAETNDSFTYPNAFNATPRPSEKAGIGALGTIDLSSANASARNNIAKGTRSFDSTPSGTPSLRTVANGLSGSGKIAFPFDTTEDPTDIETLRKRAQALEAATGYDYYRDGVSGGQTISSWPNNSDYDTVVFYEFANYSSTNNVSYTVSGTCNPTQHKGVIVVNKGNFSIAGGTQFSGGVLVFGGGTPDVNKGTYSSTGNGCFSGYANSTGLLDIGGNPSAGSVPALKDLAALSDDMDLLSWRELYS